MVRAGMAVFLLMLAAGCSAGDDSEPSVGGHAEQTGAFSGEPRTLRVEQISSGAPGRGPERPRVVLAASAAALSEETGVRVPDSGEGTYLAAYWGRKPTGGYSLAVESARLAGNRVTVRLVPREPPPDAIVTQALTYPYAVAVVRRLDPRVRHFTFVDQKGQQLGWPVRRAGG